MRTAVSSDLLEPRPTLGAEEGERTAKHSENLNVSGHARGRADGAGARSPPFAPVVSGHTPFPPASRASLEKEIDGAGCGLDMMSSVRGGGWDRRTQSVIDVARSASTFEMVVVGRWESKTSTAPSGESRRLLLSTFALCPPSPVIPEPIA
jgi:hypothetical protein